MLKASGAPGPAFSPGPTPPAIQGKPPGPPCKGAAVVCALRDPKVACGHGRSAGPNGLLELAPREIGDRVTLAVAVAGCAKAPRWDLSGAETRTLPGSRVSFSAAPWRFGPRRWISTVTPKRYRAVASTTCGGKSRTFDVSVYPSDTVSVSLSKETCKSLVRKLKGVLKVLQAWLPRVEFDLLMGGGEITAGWQEDEHSHLAFYGYEGLVGFNPLVGGALEIPFGPTASIPKWVKKYGDFYLFVRFKGGLNVNGKFARQGPRRYVGGLNGTGYIRGAIGAKIFLMNEKTVKVDVSGGTGIAGKAEALFGDPPEASIALEWEGLSADITIEFAHGYVEINRHFTVVEGGPLGKVVGKLIPDEFA